MVGFKTTELGLIPENWNTPSLSDVAELIMGQSPPSSTYNSQEIGLPFYQGKADFGFISPEARIYCSSPKKVAIENDILMSVRAPVGTVNLCNRESCIGRGLAAIRAKDVNFKFLYFQFLYLESKIASLGTGSIFKSINKHQLAEVKVAKPHSTEQTSIAHVLSQIQSAIETQGKIIQTTTELKKALMQKLFTEGLSGEPQKETEIGLVPKSWDIIMVDKLGEIITGTTPPTKNKEFYENGGFQFISPADLGETKYVYETGKEISGEGLKVARVLPKESVLVVCIGSTIGKVGLTFEDKSATNQQINAIICKEEFNPHFIYYLLDYKSDYIRSLATPSPVPIISKGKFQQAVIPISKNRKEQIEIAKILSVLDEKIEKGKQRNATLQVLFKSMLHHLMTGQIRVKDLKFA